MRGVLEGECQGPDETGALGVVACDCATGDDMTEGGRIGGCVATGFGWVCA